MRTVLWLLLIILLILLVLYLVWLFTRGRKKAETGRAEAVGAAVTPPPAPTLSAEATPQETPAEAVAKTPDDLTRIEGIGPKVARLLNSIGITTFADLASADPTRVKRALEDAGWPYMDPAGWIEQAKLAAEGKWEELATLQEQLKGGRRVA